MARDEVEKQGEILSAKAFKAPDVDMRAEDYRATVRADPLRTAMQTKELLKFALRNALVAPPDDRKSWIDMAAWALVLLQAIRKQTGLATKVSVNPSSREARMVWNQATRLQKTRWREVTDVEAKATNAYLAIREHYSRALGSVPGVGVDQDQILRRYEESKERMVISS